MAFSCIHGGKECTGCMNCESEDKQYICPVCKSELCVTDELFVTEDNKIVGCCNCIKTKEAYEILDD